VTEKIKSAQPTGASGTSSSTRARVLGGGRIPLAVAFEQRISESAPILSAPEQAPEPPAVSTGEPKHDPTDRAAEALLKSLTKPIIILLGHFGSGKSEIALNLAFLFRARGETVSLVDLDLVKPYFRSRAVREELEESGIRLIVPGDDRFYADLPILVPEVKGALSRGSSTGRVIIDLGGDDTGARVMGSLITNIDLPRTEVLFVVNTRRPFAEDLPAITAMMREIESATHLSITGLVANSHLMTESTGPVLHEGLEMARAVSRETGVPVRFCAALRDLLASLDPHTDIFDSCPVLPLVRHILPPHARRGRRRRRVTV